MNPIKTFGLAVLAALLAMAFVGASSAMAGSTTLCKADEEPCKAANQISQVHETSVGKAVLLSSETVECDALFLGDTVAALGNPLVILGHFTYTNCNADCTIKEVTGSITELQVLRTASELATVTYGSGIWGSFIHVVCPIRKMNCYYLGKGLAGHALGPLTSSQLNGSVTLADQEVEEEEESIFCPTEPKLDITMTPLEKVYIST